MTMKNHCWCSEQLKFLLPFVYWQLIASDENCSLIMAVRWKILHFYFFAKPTMGNNFFWVLGPEKWSHLKEETSNPKIRLFLVPIFLNWFVCQMTSYDETSITNKFHTVKNVMKFAICLLFNVVWKLKTGFNKINPYISHWKLINSMLNSIYA